MERITLPDHLTTFPPNLSTLNDIEVKTDALVFQNLVAEIGFAKGIIQAYDHWLVYKLPIQLDNITIPTDSGYYKILPYKDAGGNVLYEKPSFLFDKKTYPLTPRNARNRKETYSVLVKLKYIFYNNEGVEIQHLSQNDKKLYIPLILGSKFCHLHGLNDTEKMKLGECFADPLGYFLIKGQEKVVIIQEKLATNQFISYFSDAKGTLQTRITCVTDLGSTINLMLIGKKYQGLKITMPPSLGKKSAPIMVIFDILLRNLGLTTKKDIKDAVISLVLRFVEPEYQAKVYYALQFSFMKYDLIKSDGLDYMVTKINKILTSSLSNRKFKNIANPAIDEVEYKRSIVNNIYRDLFANIPNNKKHDSLSFMTARTLLCFLKIRENDNRDSWENKRLVSAAGSLEQLFNAIVTYEIKTISDNKKPDIMANLTTHITDNFVSSFGSNSWGAKNSQRKENIVEALKRETLLSIYSLINRINTPTSRQAKLPAVRLLAHSQVNSICIAETPEGTACGLVKNLAASAWISLERNNKELINRINKFFIQNTHFDINKTDIMNTPLFIDGFLLCWCNKDLCEPILKNFKKDLDFFDICVNYNRIDKILEVFCDGGRTCFPLYTIYDDKLVIDILQANNPNINVFNLNIMELVKAGAVEFVHSREQEYIYLAEFPDDVRNFDQMTELTKQELDNDTKLREEFETLEDKQSPEATKYLSEILNDLLRKEKEKFLFRKRYNYSLIDPQSILGVAGNLIPLPQNEQGPRNTYQCSMGKQALGPFNSQDHLRYDTSYKKLIDPTPPLFKTEIAKPTCLDVMPTGVTPIVAFLSMKNNNEDAIYVKEEYLHNNMRIIKYTTNTVVVKMHSGTMTEKIIRPLGTANDVNGLYHALNVDGLPRVGAYIRQGDYILGRTRTEIRVVNGKNTVFEENISIRAGVGKEGYVDKVFISNGADSSIIVRIKIRQVRTQQVGDKVASRYAQKGTMGVVLKEKDMPRIVGGPNDGVIPDFIVNPLASISRMTMGMLYELLVSKAALYDTKYCNATPFKNINIEYYQDILEKNGMDRNGFETMCRPDGKIYNVPIFVGPYYYQALRHHVKDKYQVRSIGGIVPLTRQPVRGREHEGGLRCGEMERDGLISHGCTALLLERLMVSSDEFKMFYCINCGNISTFNYELDKMVCRVCPESESKFGMLKTPYIYLLITRMLLAIGIQTTLRFNVVSKMGQIDEDLLIP